MTVAELLKSVRRRLRDLHPAESQRLWDDEELIDDYANAARDRLFLLTEKMVIDSSTDTDGTLPVCKIDVVANQASYPISPRVIGIMRVKLDSKDNPCVKVTRAELDQYYPGWETVDKNAGWNLWCADLNTDAITFIPTPKGTDTARLTVSRFPIKRLSVKEKSTDLGFREEYQEDIIPWILYLAFSKKDAETDKPDLAEYQRKLFVERAQDIRLELYKRVSSVHTNVARRAFLAR